MESRPQHASAGAVIVSVVVVVAFAATTGLVLVHAVPEGNGAVANVILGTLAAMGTQVVHYWLGSSAGSARKTEDLRAAQDALAASAPVGPPAIGGEDHDRDRGDRECSEH